MLRNQKSQNAVVRPGVVEAILFIYRPNSDLLKLFSNSQILQEAFMVDPNVAQKKNVTAKTTQEAGTTTAAAAKKKSVPAKKVVGGTVNGNSASTEVSSAATAATSSPKETKPPRITANSVCRQLLLERKYTDEQIVEEIKKIFPDAKFTKVYVSTTRVDLNKGYYKNETVTTPISKLVEKDGKVVPYEEVKQEKDAALAAQKKAKATAAQTAVTAPEGAAKKKVPIAKK